MTTNGATRSGCSRGRRLPEARTGLGKRTVRDLAVGEGERVLARVDFNVPLEAGRVTDDARIRAALPTIELLRERAARLVLCSHLGRPRGRDPATSLAPVSARLGELLGTRVHQAPEVVGPEVRRGVARIEPGEGLEREVTTLTALVEDPRRPLVVVLGGAKVTDKIVLIERFLVLADAVLIGGA